MLIEEISASQIITAILFIGILLAVQIYIAKNKKILKGKWASNQRVQLLDTTRLGPTEKVQILKVDESEFLYFFSKGNQPVIVPMVPKARHSSVRKTSHDIHLNHRASAKSSLTESKSKATGEVEQLSQSDDKMIKAISVARKKNPKVSFK